MDPELQRCLELIEKITREVKPSADPIVLDAEYLELIELVERLPNNAAGTEKGSADNLDAECFRFYASAKRS